jgi:excisionase family DNA binding protein
MITTTQAAAILGLSRRRVQAMITSGLLPAKKIGRDFLLEEEDVKALAEKERPAHRPKKEK